MRLGFGLTLGSAARSSGGVVAPVAAYRDDFTSVSGTLNGRTITGLVSYTTVLESSPGGSTVNALQVTTTGMGKLAGTSGATAAHGYRNPTTVRDYSKTRINGSVGEEYHVAADGTTLTCVQNTISSAVNMSIVPIVAGASGTTHTVTAEYPQAGDIVEKRTISYAGNDYLEIRNNGRPICSAAGQFLHCTFNGTVSSDGTTLTVNSITSGALGVGMKLINTGNLFGDRKITAQIDSTHYTISGGPLVPGLNVTSVSINATWGGLSLSAANVPATGKLGWKGSLATAGIDFHEGADMTAVSRIAITRPGRVQQVESDGTLIYRGTFEYTGTAPTTLKYRVKLNSDNSVVASGTVTAFTTDPATGTGTYALPAFTPTTLATKYWHEIYRDDAVDALGASASIFGESCAVIGGYVIVTNGQSLMTQCNAAGAGSATFAQVTGVWNPSANPSTFEMTRANTQVTFSANTPKAAFMGTVSAALGTPTMCYISGGLGGTAISTRAPGANDAGTHQVIRTTLQQQGSRCYAALHIDGQSDVGSITTYSTALQSIYTDLASLSGTTFPVFMMPVEAMFAYSDAQVETMRRFQAFELPTIDSRYHVAGFMMDLQHAAGPDALHLSTDGYAEMMRRAGFAVAAYANPGSYADRLGPSIASVSRVDDHTLDVTINLNGFTGLSASAGLGTNGKTDQWNGGLRFGTAVGTSAGVTKGDGTTAVSSITTEVYPTNCVVGTPSGGQVVVTYTFANGTFPGTAYVGGPWGSNPFNRTNDNTVNNSFASLASMLLGTISGEASVPVRPYWASNGNDYLSAS